MVSHVVLMKPKPDLTAGDKQSFIDAFDRAMREIPTVRGVRIGRRITHGAAYERSAPDMDYLAVIDFDDVAGLQVYLRHPAHDALGKLFGLSLSGAMVYDVESGGIDMLRGGLVDVR